MKKNKNNACIFNRTGKWKTKNEFSQFQNCLFDS